MYLECEVYGANDKQQIPDMIKRISHTSLRKTSMLLTLPNRNYNLLSDNKEHVEKETEDKGQATQEALEIQHSC